MTPIQAILAATDFSDDGRRAAQRAALIRAVTGAPRGMLLHVRESSWLDTLKHFVQVSSETEQSLSEEATRSLDELAATIKAETGVAMQTQLRTGKVLDAILEASTEFDLLVLGAHGLHALRDLVVGTTAQRLLSRARCPILVVKRDASGPYRRVAIGVDFSPHSQRALAFARAIAPQAEVCLMHVFAALFEGKMRYSGVADALIQEYRAKARHEAETEMSAFMASTGRDADDIQRMIEHGDHVPTKLQEMAGQHDADLIVVGKHGQSLIEQLLLGSVTIHLLAECPCDVLVTQ